MKTLTFTIVFLLLGLFTAAFAHQPGDMVVAVRDARLIASEKEVDEIAAGQVLKVLAARDSQLWVSRGKPGWISETDVIELSKAEAHFSKAFASGAGPADYAARGAVRAALDKREEAITDLKRAVELSNGRTEYLAVLAYAQLTTMKQPEAIETFTKILEKENDSAPALMGRGLAYFQVGQNKNALADLERAIKLDPDHSFPKKYRGALLHDLGRIQEAQADLDSAIAIDRFDPFARRARGRLHYDLGDYRAALEDFSVAVQADANDLPAVVGRGVIYHAIGKVSEAMDDFAKATQLGEEVFENAYLWNNLGQTQVETGYFVEAKENLRKAISLDPNFNEAKSHLAWLRVTRFAENPAEIGAAKSEVSEVFATSQPKTYWDYRALAAVNAALGDFDRAVKYQTIGEKHLAKTAPKRFEAESASATAAYKAGKIFVGTVPGRR